MRLVVFGPTGGTGRQLVDRALSAGHDVTAVARRPEALTGGHRRLTLIRGDVLDPEAVDAPVADAEAVISALGVHHRTPTAVYSAGTANITDAMGRHGVRRLVCLSSAGVTPNPAFSRLQALAVSLIVDHLYPHVYADMQRMEAHLRDTALDWTVIRAPGLTNRPPTGECVSAINRHVPRQRSLPRADVADYVLTHLDDPDTHRAWVELARSPRSR